MHSKIKLLSLMSCVAFAMQGCGDDDKPTAGAPRQVANVNTAVYSAIRQNPAANQLFVATGAANVGDEPCDVKVHRMKYDTVGGAGEPATSSGVFMLPHGDDPRCSGPLPVLLYAHGTTPEKSYDLSQFIADPTNAAASEAGLLLALYAAQGYAVIAPNYAGYADSSLDYHPYFDEAQQTAEMMTALDHVREYADMLGANLSSELFVTGLSQGGYVAMATHKALEASGETVTASAPMSGPYAMLDFVDTVMAGYVNGGATIFAPLVLTALEKSADIYDDPAEVYAEPYAAIAETALPRIGGFAASGLPNALFSGEPPANANALNAMGFGDDYLLADAFRLRYLTDLQTHPTEPAYKVRALFKEADLRDWQPQAPVLMCGAANDPVVYHMNADKMAEYWAPLVSAGLVTNLDLTATPAGPYAAAMGAFQMAGLGIADIHASTGIYCSLANLGFFGAVRAMQAQ
ncbi:MAG: hypothetical protein R3E95_24100 [Thiolinea sp.]